MLILLAGLFLANFIFNLLKNKIQTPPAPQQINLPAMQKAESATPAALPISLPAVETKPTKSNFVLNGIFFSDNDGYALVNNQIVRQNDYVDGAKVGVITASTIELDVAGEKIILTTQR